MTNDKVTVNVEQERDGRFKGEIIRINECLIDDYTVILEQAQEENKITLSQYCVLRIDELSVFNRRLQIIIK